jgi:N-acetylmuramic acid 6-phosphate (MurNAc-6-P) etherase
VDRKRARELLDTAAGRVKTAIVMHKLGVGLAEAERALEAGGGVIRRVTREEPPPV